MKKKLLFTLFILICVPSIALATDYDIFIIAGQSNTYNGEEDTGDSFPDPSIDVTDADVKQLGRYSPNNYAVIPAKDPMDHWTQPAGSVGWNLMFGRAYKAASYLLPGRKVLIIPAGKGGTGFSDNQWNEGDPLYNDLIARATSTLAAYPNSELKAIFWQQGEADGLAGQIAANAHKEAMKNMFAALRSTLNATSVPIFAGGMVPAYAESTTPLSTVQSGIEAAMGEIDYGYYVDVTGLTSSSIGNPYHFEGSSMRGSSPDVKDTTTLGLAGRYLEAYNQYKKEKQASIYVNTKTFRAKNTDIGNVTISNITF